MSTTGTEHRDADGIGRRSFLARAAGIAAGITVVPAAAVRGTQANAALRLGIIGCGGRGSFVLDKFKKHTNSKVVALHDPFPDNLLNIKERYAEAGAKSFGGIDGYKELVASDLDAVIITSPPYCHPDQAAAAVAAGKHVYCAKPVAVDTFGAKLFAETGRKAQGKVSMFVDFQTRNSPPFRDAADRVHKGDIGTIVSGQVYYQAGRLAPHADPKDTTNPATRLRNWVFDKALSGDIIVEQNVHVLDVANWYIGKHPLKAFGTGGRKGRTDVGDCWDHFIVIFWYPDDIKIDFSSGQYLVGYDDLCIRMYGTRGTIDSHYGGDVRITGLKEWTAARENTYQEPVIRNVKEFEEGIRSGKFQNNAEESAMSTLTGCLGRMAAYGERVVTWDEMLEKNERLDLNLTL